MNYAPLDGSVRTRTKSYLFFGSKERRRVVARDLKHSPLSGACKRAGLN